MAEEARPCERHVEEDRAADRKTSVFTKKQRHCIILEQHLENSKLVENTFLNHILWSGVAFKDC